MAAVLRLGWLTLTAHALIYPGFLVLAQEKGTAAASRPILGHATSFDLDATAPALVTLQAGALIRSQPSVGAIILVQLDAETSVEMLEETEGGWIRVRWGSYKGWVSRPGAVARDPMAAAVAPDTDLLTRALDALGPDARSLDLGPFRLHTDLQGEALEQTLRGAAENLSQAFAARFDVAAVAGSQAVVLFQHQEAYRACLLDDHEELPREGFQGHAGQGLAVLHAELPPAVIRRVLVHELTHLLTNSSIHSELPPWLAEGLAEDLAYSQMDPQGALKLGTLDGQQQTSSTLAFDPAYGLVRITQAHILGPRAQLKVLLHDWESPQRPRVPELVALSWQNFVSPERRDWTYPMSAFWVRYLLDHHRLAVAFRSFLTHIAEGQAVNPEGLRSSLGSSWMELDEDLHRWLQHLAREEGIL